MIRQNVCHAWRHWRYSTSALLALCAALLMAPALAFTPPDPGTFAARIEAGDHAKAREWLDAGLDSDYTGERIGTGLMIASWQGDLELMRLFIARGADVNRFNAVGEQALMHAAWRGQLAAVDLLLASGARVNNEPMRWSALHYAVFAGHREVTARLLARGADLNARSTNGSSVLMMAVYEGHETLVRDLLARGADSSVRNDRGDSALDWSFKFRRLGIARLVADQEKFAAAASRPSASWGVPVRSVAALPPPRAFAAAGARDDAPQLSELDDLLKTRAILAARGLEKSVQTLDRRIAALRARRARADMDVPAGALLEISASRAAPDDQTTRLVIDASAPQP